MWIVSRQHLAHAGETYGEHFRFALVVGILACGAGLACLIHAVVPAFCQRTCSRTIADLDQLFRQRDRRRDVERQASGLLTFIMLLMLATTVTAVAIALGGHLGPALSVGLLAFCFPITFLLTNRELERVQDA